jgi:hypothetical protein
MVSIGPSRPLSDYRELYEQSSARAVNKLTEDLYLAVKKQMVIIEHPETDDTCESALHILRTEMGETAFPWSRKAAHRIQKEKELCADINELYQRDRQEYDKLAGKLSEYSQVLTEHKLSDTIFHRKLLSPMLAIPLLVFFAPNAFLGWLISVAQFRWVMRFVKKNIKKLEFRSSIKIGFLIVIHLLLGLIVGFVVAAIFEWWAFFVVLPVWWFLALTTVNWQEQYRLFKQQLRWRNASSEFREELALLRKQCLNALHL